MRLYVATHVKREQTLTNMQTRWTRLCWNISIQPSKPALAPCGQQQVINARLPAVKQSAAQVAYPKHEHSASE